MYFRSLKKAEAVLDSPSAIEREISNLKDRVKELNAQKAKIKNSSSSVRYACYANMSKSQMIDAEIAELNKKLDSLRAKLAEMQQGQFGA